MILSELTTKLGFEVHEGGLEHLHERLEGINRSVKFLAGIEVAHALLELGERFADMGEHLEATALAAGLSTTELQKLQYAASQNAVKGDELSGALARLNRQLYSAKNGGKQANAIFAKLGIGPEQLASFKNSSQALGAIQDAMMRVSDANERQAITMQLFGRGGSNMIKFLTVGSDRTKELGESAEKMGAVISEDGVKALAEFEDAMSGLGQVAKSFLATLGSQFAPAFVEMVHYIEQAWARNLPLIQANIRVFSIKAAYYMGFLLGVITGLISKVTEFAQDHSGLLLFLAKWGPALLVAVSVFDTFVEALGRVTTGWKTVAQWSNTGWSALLWGFGKLQVLTFNLLAVLGDFFALFSPALAAGIRAVGFALAGLTPAQFTLVLAAMTALVVAMHDLYEYFFKDVPFEKLWIGRLLKRAEPIISRLRWLLKPFKEVFMLGDMSPDADDPMRPVTGQSLKNSYAKGPLANAPNFNDIFSGARQMGVKFDANDPVNTAPVKTSIMLNAPVSVTVPPGMTVEQSKYIVREGVHATFLEMLGDAHGNLQPAAAR